MIVRDSLTLSTADKNSKSPDEPNWTQYLYLNRDLKTLLTSSDCGLPFKINSKSHVLILNLSRINVTRSKIRIIRVGPRPLGSKDHFRTCYWDFYWRLTERTNRNYVQMSFPGCHGRGQTLILFVHRGRRLGERPRSSEPEFIMSLTVRGIYSCPKDLRMDSKC